jgi:thioredoxin reductase (NADPH)
VSTLTSSRFLVAVGGRPAPLDCEGGDLAISSDDIFSLEKPPGKTLCVGASYISLECAGFIAGMGYPVTVAVRSILLRGFDRECSDRIDQYMCSRGIEFKRQVTPSKLVKTDDGRIQVIFSDGSEDVFDTVLVAIGRFADTDKLGLDKVGVKTNPKNRKIVGAFEQSSVSNIYAVGDVLDVRDFFLVAISNAFQSKFAVILTQLTFRLYLWQGTPELTPVAIQAGILLARRLFGGSTEPMDYRNVCTTVFTPIEYACVGYSEDEAISKLGEDNVEVYHREFQPLEWSLSHERGGSNAFTKAIVDKINSNKVIGIHFVGPNAGEVMQGYGVAIRKGITYKDLTDTVGIHPTSSGTWTRKNNVLPLNPNHTSLLNLAFSCCAEEIVTLAVTKRSGEDAAAGGC